MLSPGVRYAHLPVSNHLNRIQLIWKNNMHVYVPKNPQYEICTPVMSINQTLKTVSPRFKILKRLILNFRDAAYRKDQECTQGFLVMSIGYKRKSDLMVRVNLSAITPYLLHDKNPSISQVTSRRNLSKIILMSLTSSPSQWNFSKCFAISFILSSYFFILTVNYFSTMCNCAYFFIDYEIIL